MTPSPSRWLYRYEAKGIQSYVLGTNRLTEIAGGSALVEDLGKVVQQVVSALGIKAPKVYANAAGSGTLGFDSRGDLEAFASCWPAVVARKAPGLQVVQAWAEYTDDKEGLHAVLKQLREARNQSEPRVPEASPLVARAARTGLPAVGSNDDSLEDRGTRRRRKSYDREQTEALLDGTPWSEDRFVQNHGEFGSSTLAVIHIDGNDMGKRVMELEGPTAYEAFSDALTKATEGAAQAAVVAVLNQDARTRREQGRTAPKARRGRRQKRAAGVVPEVLPIRPVVVGGDDVTVITRAADALVFVEAYIRAFHVLTKDKAAELGGSAMTASAGVAFVKLKSPFAASYELSEALCGWAKKQLRGRDGGQTPSAVAFHRVTQGLHTPWEAVLERELARRVGKGEIISGGMTLGPYVIEPLEGHPTLEELGYLKQALQGRKIPRGTVREWSRVVQGDEERAQARWTRLLEVAGEGAKALKKSLKELDCDPGSALDKRGHTPVFDAITLRALSVEIQTEGRTTR